MSSISSVSNVSNLLSSVDDQVTADADNEEDEAETSTPEAAVPGSSTAMIDLFASILTPAVEADAVPPATNDDSVADKSLADDILEADSARKQAGEEVVAAVEAGETERERLEALRILREKITEDRIRDMDFLAQVAKR